MAEDLLRYRRDIYSSTGNDGIIEHILSVLGIMAGTFVEFGASDGISGSNCKKLHDEGWSGLFVEPHPDRFKKLQKNYAGKERIIIDNTMIDGNFDQVIDNTLGPETKLDFCSIDIDGLDLEVFETFERHLPDIICIEGGQMLRPGHPRIPPDKAKHNIQQSLTVMIESFRRKGYRPLCSYQDTFFIKENQFGLFDVPTDPHKLYFNGLRAIPRRMPYIERCLSKVGLQNPIINKILIRTKFFEKYGWTKRKIWAKERNEQIQKCIQDLSANK